MLVTQSCWLLGHLGGMEGLAGAPFSDRILTEHQILEYQVCKISQCNNKLGGHIFKTHFNFTLTYKPGSKTTKADDHAQTQTSSYQNHISLLLSPWTSWRISGGPKTETHSCGPTRECTRSTRGHARRRLAIHG